MSLEIITDDMAYDVQLEEECEECKAELTRENRCFLIFVIPIDGDCFDGQFCSTDCLKKKVKELINKNEMKLE